MKALILFYLKKSWIPLLGLLAVSIVKLLGLTLFPILKDFELLLYLFGAWFLYLWNADDSKSPDIFFNATIAPSLTHIYLVRAIVPGILIACPLLIASWDEPIIDFSILSAVSVAKTLVVSLLLSQLSIKASSAKRFLWRLVLVYLVIHNFQHQGMLFVLIPFIIMIYLNLKAIFGERIPLKKLKYATIFAVLILISLSSKFDPGRWHLRGHVKHTNDDTSTGLYNRSFNFYVDDGDNNFKDDAKKVGENSTIEDRTEMAKKFAKASDLLREEMIEFLRDQEVIPHGEIVIAFEDAMLADGDRNNTHDGDDKCNKVCSQLAQYVGKHYHSIKNDVIKKRYESWLTKDEKSQETQYLYNVAVNAKVFHHLNHVGKKLHSTSNPLTGARHIIDEISAGLKGIEDFAEHDQLTKKDMNLFVQRELELKAM